MNMDMNKMLQQVQELQAQMAKAQEELARTRPSRPPPVAAWSPSRRPATCRSRRSRSRRRRSIRTIRSCCRTWCSPPSTRRFARHSHSPSRSSAEWPGSETSAGWACPGSRALPPLAPLAPHRVTLASAPARERLAGGRHRPRVERLRDVAQPPVSWPRRSSALGAGAQEQDRDLARFLRSPPAPPRRANRRSGQHDVEQDQVGLFGTGQRDRGFHRPPRACRSPQLRLSRQTRRIGLRRRRPRMRPPPSSPTPPRRPPKARSVLTRASGTAHARTRTTSLHEDVPLTRGHYSANPRQRSGRSDSRRHNSDMLSPAVENLVAQLTRLPGVGTAPRTGSRSTCSAFRATRRRLSRRRSTRSRSASGSVASAAT